MNVGQYVFGTPPPRPEAPASHANCDDWTYDTHPKRAELTHRCGRLEDAFLHRISKFDRAKHDTRIGHAFLFRLMVPAACSCIAGTFRGDPSCPAILGCYVGTGDEKVGAPPRAVAEQMRQFDVQCASLVQIHAKYLRERNPKPHVALLKFTERLATILERFLTIHPFKDGNGHTGRLLIYLMMVRAGYAPKHWSIDAKQPYGDALSAHRRGKPGALQKFLLEAIVGAPASAQNAAT